MTRAPLTAAALTLSLALPIVGIACGSGDDTERPSDTAGGAGSDAGRGGAPGSAGAGATAGRGGSGGSAGAGTGGTGTPGGSSGTGGASGKGGSNPGAAGMGGAGGSTGGVSGNGGKGGSQQGGMSGAAGAGAGGVAGNGGTTGGSAGASGAAGSGGSATGGAAGTAGSSGAGGGGNTCSGTGALLFQDTIDGANNQYGGDVAVDAQGNAFATGYYWGKLTLAGTTHDAGGNTEAWLLKTDSTGKPLWGKSLGDGPTGFFGQTAGKVAAHADGGVTMMGAHQGTIVDAGGAPLVSKQGYHVFLAGYDKDGTHVFSTTFGDNVLLNATSNAAALAVDAAGASIAVGTFQGTASFAGGTPLVSPSGHAGYIGKVDATGAHVFSKAWGQDSGVHPFGVTTDKQGNVIVVGNFNQPTDFGGGTLTPKASTSAFLVKYDPAGVWLENQVWGDGAEARHVAVASNGDLVVTGLVYGTIDLGGGTLSGVGKNVVWVARLTSAFGHVWSKGFLDIAFECMRLDPCDNLLLSGMFNENTNLGGPDLVTMTTQALFYAKLGGDGSHVWSHATANDDPMAAGNAGGIIADANANVFVAGYFSPTASFGGPTLTSMASDAFLIKLSP